MFRRPRPFVLVLLPLLAGVACRPHVSSIGAPAVARLTEDRCWGASISRTSLPPDSVAVRLQRAFLATGLSAGRWRLIGDTTWTTSGPAVLSSGFPRATYSARAVAVGHGDSTDYRVYAAFGAPPEGWDDSEEAALVGRHVIPLCHAIDVAAAIPRVLVRLGAKDTLPF